MCFIIVDWNIAIVNDFFNIVMNWISNLVVEFTFINYYGVILKITLFHLVYAFIDIVIIDYFDQDHEKNCIYFLFNINLFEKNDIIYLTSFINK